MSYVIKQRVGKYTYLYESTSYRNKAGEPRATRFVVGKVDPVTGEAVYKPEYIARMSDSGTPVTNPRKHSGGIFTVNAIKNSTIKDFGNYYFLEHRADSIGLKKILKDSMGKYGDKIRMLASYLSAGKNPLMYCQRWMRTTETPPVGDMSSQRISELPHEITEEDRSNFYNAVRVSAHIILPIGARAQPLYGLDKRLFRHLGDGKFHVQAAKVE
jgi:hypothetical protein